MCKKFTSISHKEDKGCIIEGEFEPASSKIEGAEFGLRVPARECRQRHGCRILKFLCKPGLLIIQNI